MKVMSGSGNCSVGASICLMSLQGNLRLLLNVAVVLMKVSIPPLLGRSRHAPKAPHGPLLPGASIAPAHRIGGEGGAGGKDGGGRGKTAEALICHFLAQAPLLPRQIDDLS